MLSYMSKVKITKLRMRNNLYTCHIFGGSSLSRASNRLLLGTQDKHVKLLGSCKLDGPARKWLYVATPIQLMGTPTCRLRFKHGDHVQYTRNAFTGLQHCVVQAGIARE